MAPGAIPADLETFLIGAGAGRVRAGALRAGMGDGLTFAGTATLDCLSAGVPV